MGNGNKHLRSSPFFGGHDSERKEHLSSSALSQAQFEIAIKPGGHEETIEHPKNWSIC
jgi:hypothetical protein